MSRSSHRKPWANLRKNQHRLFSNKLLLSNLQSLTEALKDGRIVDWSMRRQIPFDHRRHPASVTLSMIVYPQGVRIKPSPRR